MTERIFQTNGVVFAQVAEGVPSPELGEQAGGLWWFWLLLAILFIAVTVWVVRRFTIGGPWIRG